MEIENKLKRYELVLTISIDFKFRRVKLDKIESIRGRRRLNRILVNKIMEKVEVG